MRNKTISRTIKSFIVAILSYFGVNAAMSQSGSMKPEAIYGQRAKSFQLATGSPGELGLLQALGEALIRRKVRA